MQLSIVSPAPHYPGRAGDLSRDLILYFVMSKVQPRVMPGTAGDSFRVNPRVGPRPITPGAMVRLFFFN